MTGTVARSADQKSDIALLGPESIVPPSSRELFWRARYLREGPGLGHLPFLFWLVTTLRPKRAVTLELGSGALHFGLCQAIDKIGYDAACHGFGTWPPKDHQDKSPTGEVPEALASYNATEYQDMSRLAAEDPQEAHCLFEQDSIDLLIVESKISARLLKSLAEQWMPKMSETGVVMLCGTSTLNVETATELSKLRKSSANVRFDHDSGLDILITGDKTSDRLTRLVGLGKNDAASMSIQRIFSRLGRMHINEWLVRDKANWARKLNGVVENAEVEAVQLREKLDRVTAEFETLNEAYDRRQMRTASLERMQADRDAAHEEEIAELTKAQKALLDQKAAMEAMLAESRADASSRLVVMTRALESGEADALALRKELKVAQKALEQKEVAQADAITRLTRQLELSETANIQMQEKLSEQSAYSDKLRLTVKAQEKITQQLTREREGLLADRDAYAKLREQMMDSTSWRVTAPLRRVRKLFGNS